MLLSSRRIALSRAPKRSGLPAKLMHSLCIHMLMTCALAAGQSTLSGWVTMKAPPKRRRHAEETPPRESPRESPD